MRRWFTRRTRTVQDDGVYEVEATGRSESDGAAVERLRDLRRVALDVAAIVDDNALRARMQRAILAERWARGHPSSRRAGGTEDKGRVVYFCLRDSEGRLLDRTAMIHVLLHEMAHVASASVGHTPEFAAQLDRLTDAARARRHVDATPRGHVVFCGTHVPT